MLSLNNRRSNREYSVNLTKRRYWFGEGETPPPTPPTPPVVPPSPDPAPEAKFTQADVDKMVGNRAKEAAAAAVKKILKDLGVENVDDPKAVETIKGNLAAHKQAEDAKKTAEDKLNEQILALQKERDEAKDATAKALAQRRADMLNSQLEKLASAAKAQVPSDVVDYLNKHHEADVAKLLGDDDKFDDKTAATLIENVKKARAHWFGMSGMGTMSLREGRNVDVSAQERQRGTQATQKAIRKGF